MRTNPHSARRMMTGSRKGPLKPAIRWRMLPGVVTKLRRRQPQGHPQATRQGHPAHHGHGQAPARSAGQETACEPAGLPAVAMAYVAEEFHPSGMGGVMGLYISGTGLGGMTG